MDILLLEKYAITTRRSSLYLFESQDFPIISKEDKESLDVEEGTLIQLHGSSKKRGKVNVQVKQFTENKNVLYENMYECNSNCLQVVTQELWPFVIGIRNKEKRLALVRREAEQNWIVNLKINDMVSVPGECVGVKSSFRFDCIVRYIGMVPQMNPYGYYFGLELLV